MGSVISSGISAGGSSGAGVGEMLGGLIGGQQAQSGRDEASRLAGEAYNELMGLGLPPDLSKQLILKQYTAAGKLTPELEQSINLGISQASQVQEDPNLKGAQMSALQDLQQRGRVGLTAQDRANLNQIRDETQRDANAKQQQILQQMQQRGMGGSGAELIAQLQESQGAANRASTQGDTIAAQGQQNALQAMTNSGNLAGNIRAQDFSNNTAKAKAEDEFSRFNVQNQIAQQQRNVAAQNQAQAANLQNAQNISNANVVTSNNEAERANNAQQNYWDNLMKRANLRSGAYQSRSNQFNSDADREAGQWAAGGKALMGYNSTGGKTGGDSGGSGGSGSNGMGGGEGALAGGAGDNMGGGMEDMAGSMLASGGAVVPGHAKVRGNSPVNDTVPYKLSPGEIVIPRTVAEKSEEEIAKFVALMRPKKGNKMPLSDILKKLLAAGERNEGRIATDAEDTAAKQLAMRGEEAVQPSSSSILDPLAESTSPAPSQTNFTMSDNNALPGMMAHNQAQADYLANSATQRAANANENLPALSAIAAKNTETGLVPYAQKAENSLANSSAVDAEFEDLTKKVSDPVTKSLMQKYGPKALTAAGIGGLAAYGLSGGDDEKPKKAAAIAPVVKPASVPVDDTEDDEEETTSTPKAKATATIPKETVDPRDALPASSEDNSAVDKLKKLLNIQFGDNTNASVNKLKQVQDEAANQKRNNESGRALAEFGAAMTGIKGYKADLSNFDRMDQAADKQVSDYKEQVAAEKTDPNSAYSQGMRDYMKRYGVNISGQASGSDLEKVAPQIAAAYEKDQALAQAKEIKEATLKQQAFENEMKRGENAMNRDLVREKISASRDQKAKAGSDKIFSQTAQQLEQMRGAPAASQAEKDIYAAQKAKTLTELFPNPTQSQVNLLASEVAKIASGGQASIHELEGITPHTLAGDMSKYVEKFTNSPTPANAQEFMKNLTKYSNSVAKDAQQVIKDRYGRIIESKKSKLSPDDYETLQNQYINRFKNDQSTQEKMPETPITIRRKTDGLQKTVSPDQAKSILKDPNFEEVK